MADNYYTETLDAQTDLFDILEKKLILVFPELEKVISDYIHNCKVRASSVLIDEYKHAKGLENMINDFKKAIAENSS